MAAEVKKIDLSNLISNGIFEEKWKQIMQEFYEKEKYDSETDMCEVLGFSFSINPRTDCFMSKSSSLFELDKALAMHLWYTSGERDNDFITTYFPEYKHCIDKKHILFNSNYGYYAYKLGLLDMCVNRLVKDNNTRQACFCINNNDAMSDESIDKLCTNSIMFFIRDSKLEMFVQMRSSNILSLLPYDIFMFQLFYDYVYVRLNRSVQFGKNKPYSIGSINMQIASAHYKQSQVPNIYTTTSFDDRIISLFWRSIDIIYAFMDKSLKNVNNRDNSVGSQNIFVDLSNIIKQEENGTD